MLNVEMDSKIKVFKDKKKETEPLRIYFLSSGEQSPFHIRVHIKETPHPYYQLEGLFNGKLKLERINGFDL